MGALAGVRLFLRSFVRILQNQNRYIHPFLYKREKIYGFKNVVKTTKIYENDRIVQ